MPVILACDTPECGVSVPARIENDRPAGPAGWWVLKSGDGGYRVACCERHLVEYLKKGVEA